MIRALVFLALVLAVVGCGTTRMTDTTRALSEMRLVSQAIDQAVMQLDFEALRGQSVYLDTQYLEGTVDKGYLISALRQELLAQGCLLQEERTRAIYVVEARAGGVGTDKHSLLVGTPAMSLPAIVPGVPSAIPEIALVKKTDQQGGAKLAVFAYNRLTGKGVGQPALVEAGSNLKDTWFFGAGPYRRGSIQRDSEFAGEKLPTLPNFHFHADEATAKADPERELKQTSEPGLLPSMGASLFGFDKPLFPISRPVSPTAVTGPETPAKKPSEPGIAQQSLPAMTKPRDNERP
jgi:hypothetical protein